MRIVRNERYAYVSDIDSTDLLLFSYYFAVLHIFQAIFGLIVYNRSLVYIY